MQVEGHVGRGGRRAGCSPSRPRLLPFWDPHLSVSCPAEIDLLMDDLGSMRLSGRICDLHGRAEQVSTPGLEITRNQTGRRLQVVTSAQKAHGGREKLPPPAQDSPGGYFCVFGLCGRAPASLCRPVPPGLGCVRQLLGPLALSNLLIGTTQPAAVRARLLFLSNSSVLFPRLQALPRRAEPYFSVDKMPRCARRPLLL